MLFDMVEEYDKQKMDFLINLREKSIEKLVTVQDSKKIISFLNRAGIIGIDEKKQIVYIGVPNEFVLSQAKKFFKKHFDNVINEIYNNSYKVDFIVYGKFQTGKHKLQKDIKKILNIKKNGIRFSQNYR
ncbi:hypothetical protein [Candidatus Vampirococcus lugosii]|uniref:Chromosomal replication initiation ATPase DnaA n=1 Tax=Candidatus Vampirococcus lugosii TaxID=2789015 RepID=A0ABS5QLY6_9BACT|nr:hypothetical protein [Candidatus Vampirococcus lugosii]MBS8122182.1 Chromosomal replication initiation ATPase DnaA [Candidatus Vampirococcus lugosii]